MVIQLIVLCRVMIRVALSLPSFVCQKVGDLWFRFIEARNRSVFAAEEIEWTPTLLT
jgi:hypothetical protein